MADRANAPMVTQKLLVGSSYYAGMCLKVLVQLKVLLQLAMKIIPLKVDAPHPKLVLHPVQ